MIKIRLYKNNKTFMFPNGELATPAIVMEKYPAIQVFPHIIETDEAEQVMFAIENLAAMRSFHNLDESLTEEEAIQALEDIRNAPPEEPGITAEERIAAAMEFQNLMML